MPKSIIAERFAQLAGALLALSLSGCQASYAEELAIRRVSGANLSQPLSMNLSVSPGSFVIVRADQRTADYQIALYRQDGIEVLKRVNLSAHKAVDELMLIEASDCRHCRIELSADSAIDQRGAYRVSIETRSESRLVNAERDTLRAISMVGELNFQLNHSKPDDDTNYLTLASELVRELLTQAEPNQHTLHARFLALQLAGMQRRTDTVVKLADEIAATAKESISLYSIQAVYELARHANTIATKHAYFERGMVDAQTISEPLLYAKGANYLAISLTREGRFEDSLGLFEEVSDIYSREQNLGALMFALHNLSWANQRAGHLPKAIAYAAQQKLLAEEYDAQSNVIWALYNMAIAYSEQGDHYAAEQFLDQALDRYAALPESKQRDNDGIYGAILEQRAESLLRLGDVVAARDLASIIKAHYVEGNFARNLANFRMLEGNIAIAASRFDDGQEILVQALDYYNENEEVRSAGLAYYRLAELALTQKNYVLASQYNAAALKNLSGTEDYFSLAKAFSQAVDLLGSMRAHAAAAELADDVAEFIGRFGRDEVEAEFAFRRAKVARELGQGDAAIVWIDKAKVLVEEKLPKVKRRDLRRQYLALQKSLFELNVALLIDQGRIETALQVVESFKARTLNETISQVRNTQSISPQLQQAREVLHQQILRNASTWYGDARDQNMAVLANARALSTELEKVELAVEAQQGAIGPDLGGNLLRPLPRVESAKETMIFYFVGQQQSWMWLVDSTGVDLFELPAYGELSELVKLVKQQVSSHPRDRLGNSAYTERQRLLQLGELLLGPLLSRIDFSEIDNLTVIADGPLHGLSFAPLLLRTLEGPLLAHTAISYAPSHEALAGIALRAQRKNSGPVNADVLIIADPIDLAAAKPAFHRLPETVVEAQHISSVLGDRAQVLQGAEASKQNVLKALTKRHRILHFATHGLLHNQTPALSGLVFSRTSEQAYFWLTPEISSSNLQADLVVLSACESSIGREVAGEGLLSLSRAFIEAGASHVIGTLWKVQDAATAGLTSRFYSNLLDDSLAISVALQTAQLAVYNDQDNDWRDPYYWAGFQLQGGWQTLSYGSD